MRGASDGCVVSEDLACPVVRGEGSGHKVRDGSGKRHLTSSKGPAACDIPGTAWPPGAVGARTLCNMVWTSGGRGGVSHHKDNPLSWPSLPVEGVFTPPPALSLAPPSTIVIRFVAIKS
eukprot:8946420-Pyramimonas_sp.AAC.2